jgi:hypothetical protein
MHTRREGEADAFLTMRCAIPRLEIGLPSQSDLMRVRRHPESALRRVSRFSARPSDSAGPDTRQPARQPTMKKWILSIAVFLLVLVPAFVIGTIVVLLFFGPHTGNTSATLALLVACLVFGVPFLVARMTFRKCR